MLCLDARRLVAPVIEWVRRPVVSVGVRRRARLSRGCCPRVGRRVVVPRRLLLLLLLLGTGALGCLGMLLVLAGVLPGWLVLRRVRRRRILAGICRAARHAHVRWPVPVLVGCVGVGDGRGAVHRRVARVPGTLHRPVVVVDVSRHAEAVVRLPSRVGGSRGARLNV